MDIAASDGNAVVDPAADNEHMNDDSADIASRNDPAPAALELSEHAKETVLYLAVRAHFTHGSVSEVSPGVTRAHVEDTSRRFYATLKTFLPRLPLKKHALPERLKSVTGVDMSGKKMKGRKPYNYKYRVEELSEFMLERARTVLNADVRPGNICIVGCPRNGPGGASDERITCARCSVTYHTKCLAVDGLKVESLITAYFCSKCEDESNITEFQRWRCVSTRHKQKNHGIQANLGPNFGTKLSLFWVLVQPRGLDRKKWSPFYYKRRVEQLNKFMLEKSRAILNADAGPGNNCIVGCPRGLGGERVTCASCGVNYHTMCLAIDGLDVDGLIDTYYCPKCEDDTKITQFVRGAAL